MHVRASQQLCASQQQRVAQVRTDDFGGAQGLRMCLLGTVRGERVANVAGDSERAVRGGISVRIVSVEPRLLGSHVRR